MWQWAIHLDDRIAVHDYEPAIRFCRQLSWTPPEDERRSTPRPT